MKKTFIVVLCLCLLIAAFSGCNQGGKTSEASGTSEDGSSLSETPDSQSNEEKPDKISVISGAETAPSYEVVAKEYKETYGIEVELIVDAYDNIRNKIITAATSGSTEDLGLLDTVWPAEFLAAGIAYPLNEFITEEKISQFVPVSIEQLIVDGQVMGLPFINDTKWLYYNDALLEAGGYENPPATWEEAIEMSEDLVNQGLVKYGTAWGASQAEGLVCDWAALVCSFGGDWYDESGEWALNSENAVDALTMLTDSLNNGFADPASITYTDRTVLNSLMAKDIAFTLNWSYAWGVTNDDEESNVVGDIKIGLVPGSEKYGTKSGSTPGGGGLCILQNSDAKEWAYKFLDMITEPDFQAESIEISSNVPVIASVYEDSAVLEKYPHLADCVPQYEFEMFRPQVAQYSEWSNIMQQNLHSALTGAASPKDALDKAQQEVTAQITE